MSVIARLGLASANQRVRRVSARQLGPDRNIMRNTKKSLENVQKTFRKRLQNLLQIDHEYSHNMHIRSI